MLNESCLCCVVGGESYDLFSVALEISYIMTTNFSRIL
jgi:hypothetical protein